MGEPVTPPVPRRRGLSHGQLMVRRVLVFGLIVAVVAAVGWVGALAIGATGDEAPPSPPTTTAPAPPKPLKIIFPEGFTRREMADRITAVNGIARKTRKIKPKLAEREYLRLTQRSRLPGEFAGDGKRRHLEGFLFPATYEFLGTTTTKQLLNKQLVAFNRSWAKLDLAYARSKNLTAYDVLIIASMVEEETLAPEERPLVAAVIYNRLRLRMPLGIDATIRYGLNVPGTESLRQSHLNSDTPYNTRKFAGLPPTPITNPGLASMQAAAHPANAKYLYFARKPDKVHHFFTASEDAFLRYLAEQGYGP